MYAKLKFLVFIIVLTLLTACVGDAPDPSVELDEGFDFTEEDASELSSEEGFEFSEEEAADTKSEEGFSFSEEEVGDEPGLPPGGGDGNDSGGMEFDEDEGMDVFALNDPRLPPDGVSSWLINYDDGFIICPSFTETIPADDSDSVTVLLGDEAIDFIISGLDGGPNIYFFLTESYPEGTHFVGYYEPPGTGLQLKYDLYFLSNPNEPSANFLEGTISAEQEDCEVSRSFAGFRQD